MRCGRPSKSRVGAGIILTVIDDCSRYIIHWELCSSMTSEDVSRTNHGLFDNLTPRDFYLELSQKFKKISEITKQKSIQNRIYENRMMNYQIE